MESSESGQQKAASTGNSPMPKAQFSGSPGGRARPRADRILRPAQALLLLCGAALLAAFAVAQVDAVHGRARALEAFAQARSQQGSEPQIAEPAFTATTPAPLEYSNDPDQSLWGKTRVAAYRASLSTHTGTPLGVIRISSIGLEAPIFEGTSEITLNRGIGRIEGTANLDSAGNVGLAGHRDGFFRGLKDVEVGDSIHMESLVGTAHYRITELSIVEPHDVYVLAPTETATLTLVTCYPFYFVGEAPQRYIVKAEAMSATASNPL
jgi:sortase A